MCTLREDAQGFNRDVERSVCRSPCACTAVIEAAGGNYAVAQALLRHKTMDTTLRVYKKQITPQGLLAGMKQFQKSLGK